MVGNRVNIVIIGMFCLSGKLSVDKLRLKLDNAMKKNDPDLLEKVIAECVGSGHVELMPDIQEARLHLESLEESGRGLFIPILFLISSCSRVNCPLPLYEHFWTEMSSFHF